MKRGQSISMARQSSDRNSSAPMPSTQKPNVLIVEDVHTVDVCRQILGTLELDLATAQTEQNVMDCVSGTDFAVILLNVRMPAIDGFAIARRIRQCERSRYTPIIFLTSTYDDTVSSFRGYEVGGVDYILKPLVPEILRSKISVFVDLYQYNANLSREIAERKLAEHNLLKSEERLREFAAHIQSVREEERTNIAREIHDELGQALTGLKMDLSWLEKRLPSDLKEPAKKVRSMFQLIDSTIQVVRKISSELRPQVLDDVGLLGTLKWQAREFQARAGIRCKVELPADDILLDQERSTAVFRIFQEVMTNVVRHARATKVDIKLRMDSDHLILSIADNGCGISQADLRSPRSLGLLGIRERAFLLGGIAEITGTEGKGTSVTLSLPLQAHSKT
jgi:signal transduction histidine kinase